jgi:hypothetical protein
MHSDGERSLFSEDNLLRATERRPSGLEEAQQFIEEIDRQVQ